MGCQVETYAYPQWWAATSTVRIILQTSTSAAFTVFTGAKTDVEFLPQGIAYVGSDPTDSPNTELVPWDRVLQVRKMS